MRGKALALFCVIYMKEPLKLDYLWACLCLIGAAYFMFRGFGPPAPLLEMNG